MIRIGIDYSINSPCVCVAIGGTEIKNCRFYVLRQKKLHESISHPQIELVGDWKDNKTYPLMTKYHRNSEMVLGILGDLFSYESINIEGYSYGSFSSSVIQLAENGGILRYRLIGFNYKDIPPTVVKKNATGKGNAKKDQMYQAWIREGGFDLKTLFKTENDADNPLSDIVDSYFIMKS